MAIQSVKLNYEIGDLVGLIHNYRFDGQTEFGLVIKDCKGFFKIKWDDGVISEPIRDDVSTEDNCWINFGNLTAQEELVIKMKYL